MLAQGLPVRDAGPPGRGDRGDCETAVEVARLSANPHYLFWALFELGWAHYFAGDLDAAIAACEESARVGQPGRRRRCRRPAAGRAGRWRSAASSPATSRRARALMLEVFGERPGALGAGRALLRLGEPGARRARARRRRRRRAATRARAEADAAALGLQLPRALAARAARAVAARARRRRRRGAARRPPRSPRPRPSARRCEAAFSRAAARPRARRRRRARARRSRRCARPSSELDACGSVRVRDEVRRELRKLGARARAARAARRGEDGGMASLTEARARDRRRWSRDRMTNREIAARRCSSARRRSSRTCATSSSSSACRRASRSRAPSSASAASGGAVTTRRRRSSTPTPRGSTSSATSRSSTARLRAVDNVALGFAGDLAGRRALRRRAGRHGRRRARVGVGAAGRARRASACCWPSTPSWRRSSRSPAARTSGRGG